VLQQTLAAERLKIHQQAPTNNPELVLVVETVGSVSAFANAVKRLPGLEWLLESPDLEIAPDEDFFVLSEPETPLSARLYLLGSNAQALEQLLALWERFKADPTAKFAHGLAPIRQVFLQLRDIRYWSVSDRIDETVKAYWRNRLGMDGEAIRFEIEAWHFPDGERNARVAQEVEALVEGVGGRVLDSALISEIAYHGFLVELPSGAVRAILEGATPDLVLSHRVMSFRPKAQTQSLLAEGELQTAIDGDPAPGNLPPVVALLDGLPLANHQLLAGRLQIDDPDGWASDYEAKDRCHGTAMASLIALGDLAVAGAPSTRLLYVRPILRTDPRDFRDRRSESAPEDRLLLDLVHRAVRRIFDGEGGRPAEAPTVRVINLSVGDPWRVFDRELSPWAKLLDWLAWRYRVLFVVSAGNCADDLVLATGRDTLRRLPDEDRKKVAFDSLVSTGPTRRLLSPAEGLNVLTVGATHSDNSVLPAGHNGIDLFDYDGVSAYSRIGHGFRRAIKPDILMPGGRVLFREKPATGVLQEVVEQISHWSIPGHQVAAPPMPRGGGQNLTTVTRGTSNATALASRASAQVFDMLQQLRASLATALPDRFDAVLIKALVAHGAAWDGLATAFLANASIHANSAALREFLARWLGYGVVNLNRVLECTDERVTLLGVGELGDGDALVFSAPLPPSLAGTKIWRRMTLTLAWLSPTNCSHQAYRRARLWVSPPTDELRLKREDSANHYSVNRGTLQHERLEGDSAVAYADGTRIEFKVNCAADAGALDDRVPFALCVTLEVAESAGIQIYQEIRDRISVPVAVRPEAR